MLGTNVITTDLGPEAIKFPYCETNCDRAWALRILQHSAGTLKIVKNLPRWLVPCPEPLRSLLNLQTLSLGDDVSSLTDDALVGLRGAKLRMGPGYYGWRGKHFY